MFHSTGVFGDLICPDDGRCARPYCSFWHDPDAIAGPSQSSPVQNTSSFVVTNQKPDPYNPYSQQIPSFSGYSASVAPPASIPSYNVAPAFCGYIASCESDTRESISGYHGSPISETISAPSHTVQSPPGTISQTSVIRIKPEPVDEDDCILIEAEPKVKEEGIVINESASSGSEIVSSIPPPKKLPTDLENPGNLLQCAKSISKIDAEIERLTKLRQQHKQKAANLRGPISTVEEQKTSKKSKPILEYVPKKIKSEQPSSSLGYTPTPLAELERKKEEKRKAEEIRTDNKRKKDDDCPRAVDGRRNSLARVSHEDLFGVSPKKVRIENELQKNNTVMKLPEVVAGSRAASSSTDSLRDVHDDEVPSTSVSVTKGIQLTAEQLAVARQRIARPGAPVNRYITSNKRVASAVEQLHARMEIAAKEKQKSNSENNGNSLKKIKTLEQQFGENRKRDQNGRIAKINTEAIKRKPTLQEPTSTKVPSTIRLQYLNRLFNEFLNFLPIDEAKTQAEREEKSVLDKVKHKQGYAVAIVNALKRIRDINESKDSKNVPNKVSHDQVLLGKAYGICTVKANGPKRSVQVTEEKLYSALENDYLLTKDQLRKNSYPVWESDTKVFIEPSFYDKKRFKTTFAADFDMKRVCVRCTKEFQLNIRGRIVKDSCVYHLKSKSRMPGKPRNNEARYPCCGGDDTMEGCQIGIAHVFDTLRESELFKFISTPKARGAEDPRSKKIYALDCEMIYTVWGPTLARVTVIDYNESVVLDEIVKPAYTVIDYNTTFSGITAAHLDNAVQTLESIQQKLFDFVNNETILIGHSLESDLKAMRIVHDKIVDTAVLFPHRIDDQKKRGLRELCLDKLGKSIQDDIDGHDSKEDSIAALQLVMYKVKFDGKLK